MIITEGWNTLPQMFPIILSDCSYSEVTREGALHPPALCSVEEIWFHLSVKLLYCRLFGSINNFWMFFEIFQISLWAVFFLNLLLHSFDFLQLWFMLYASNEQMTDWRFVLSKPSIFIFFFLSTAHYEPLQPKCTSVHEDTDVLGSAWSCILTMVQKKRGKNAREDKPTWQLREGKRKLIMALFPPRDTWTQR